MAQVFLIGSVTADLELRISARKVPYIRFGISEPVGYRELGTGKRTAMRLITWEGDAIRADMSGRGANGMRKMGRGEVMQ